MRSRLPANPPHCVSVAFGYEPRADAAGAIAIALGELLLASLEVGR
jgi:hypothetical protein